MPAAILIGGFSLSSNISVNNWDNLEFYVPSLWFAHQQVLDGEIPYWNQHQDLGRPVMAQAVFGVFYPPYTFGVWLAEMSGLGQKWMLAIIIVMHSGMAGLALYCVARDFGVRPVFALVASLSAVLGGNMIYVGSVWCFVVPYLGWYTWSIWGLKRLIDMRTPVAGYVVATVAMATMFHMGHSEWAFRSWVAAGFFSVGYALVRRCLIKRIGWLVAAVGVAILLTMPSVMPLLEHLVQTERKEALPFAAFSARPLKPQALIGLLLPVYGGDDGFFSYEKHLCTLYQGAWLAPAIIAAFAVSVRCFLNRRRDIGVENTIDGDAVGHLALLTGLGLIFVWLSLGPHGRLHSWTYWIPVWSRFRWPFKLLDRAIPFLAVAGALALEVLSHRSFSRGRLLFAVGVAIAMTALWLVRSVPLDAGSLLAGVAGLVSVLLLALVHYRWARGILLVATVVAAIGVMLICHKPDRYKHYINEQPGSFTPDVYGIDNSFRVLPLSPDNPVGVSLQELGLFETATMNAYYGATGERHALAKERLNKFLPANISGLPPRGELPILLNSHLIRAFNIKYLIVAKNDTDMIRFVEQATRFTRFTETNLTIVYGNDDALRRAYFATERHALTDFAVEQGLLRNYAEPTTAYVQGADDSGPIPVGKVKAIDWQQNHVSIDVDAPDGGYLVISMNHDSNWSASIDGQPVPLHLTNGTLTGVNVPPRADRIELVCGNGALVIGAYMALGGSMLGIVVAFLLRHVTSRASLSSPTEVDGDD